MDGHPGVLGGLAEDTALALLNVGRLPRGVELVQGDQPALDVGADAHPARRADRHPDQAGPHPVEEGLLLGIAVGVTDGGDLLAGDAAGDELGDGSYRKR